MIWDPALRSRLLVYGDDTKSWPGGDAEAASINGHAAERVVFEQEVPVKVGEVQQGKELRRR